MPYIQWEGIYRGAAKFWEVVRAKEGQAVCVSIQFDALEVLGDKRDDGGPREWTPLVEPHHARGRFWVVKKDGTLNENAVERLCVSLGWDGSFSSIAGGGGIDIPCRFTVKREVGQDGKDYYPVAWVDPYEMAPTKSEFAATPSTAQTLDAQYGGQLRAMAGQHGKAAAKVKPAAATKLKGAAGEGEVPF